VKAKIAAFFLLVTFSCLSFAENEFNPVLEESFCAYGSHQQLYKFFSNESYIVVAQGKLTQTDQSTQNFFDVLFLVSPDMGYFHTVTLDEIKPNHFKACISHSAREIDYQFAPPLPKLLTRKNREHQTLLDNMPIDASCSSDSQHCTPWSEWSQALNTTIVMSAYAYSSKSKHDPYNEIVELSLDSKTINPTRGALTELTRTKYALRVRNELKESVDELKKIKATYKQIHSEVDHKLALLFLSLTETRAWSLDQLDRDTGLVTTLLQGNELKMYPMTNKQYQSFIQK